MIAQEINEHYFDQPSRENSYILGTFIPSAMLLPEVQGLFIDPYNMDLMRIIDRELDVQYLGSREPWDDTLTLRNVPHLYSMLKQLGLGVPMSQRVFPIFESESLADISRGFLDARSNVNQRDPTKITNLHINFCSPQFLTDLYHIFREHAGIMCGPPSGKKMNLGHSDSIRVFHFIYEDWGFIQRSGLYLPSKKDAYNPEYEIGYSSHPKVRERRRRIEIAKQLLLDGKVPNQFYKELGYANPSSLYQAFKNETGITTREWLAAQQADKIKK